MVWFRENWYEEVLRQLRQALVKCRAVAFENRANVAEASVTPHTLNFVAKLVSTFGVGVENNVASVVTTTFSSAASESLARRAQATAQDPVFQRMKSQFTSDFDFRFYFIFTSMTICHHFRTETLSLTYQNRVQIQIKCKEKLHAARLNG